jgi:ABC-type Mn2+/Zn2+ transport system ATPase subunit
VDEPVVALTDVRAIYEGERHATLAGVTMRVARGEQVAITGPNGAGKTTILEVIDGLLPITSGSVRAFGETVTRDSHHLRSRIAYVPQNLFFTPDTPFLVRDVVIAARFGRIESWRLPGSADRHQVDVALDAVGMTFAARRPIGRLSGGQQRKVLLARALAQEARLLLLDEPTANLDPTSKHEVANLVASVRAALDATSIVVSHEAGPLLGASDRVVAIDAGRIVDRSAANLVEAAASREA